MYRVQMICRPEFVSGGTAVTCPAELRELISRRGIDDTFFSVKMVAPHQFHVETTHQSLAAHIRRRLVNYFICDPVEDVDFVKQRIRVLR